MKRILYLLPDSNQNVVGFCLCEEGEKALLFIPPVQNLREASITVAERTGEDAYQDSVSSSFPLKDWGAAATMAIFLLFVVK